MKTICFILLSFITIHTTGQDNNDNQVATNSKGSLPFEMKNNIISFNYGDLATSRVSLSYERLIKKGMMGIKVPVSFSIEQYPYGPKYYGGLGLNYYPLGQRKLTYCTGITVHLGTYTQDDYDYYYPNYGVPYYYREGKDHIYGGAYITNGLAWNISKNFSISGQFGLGVIDLESEEWGRTHATGELNASIHF